NYGRRVVFDFGQYGNLQNTTGAAVDLVFTYTAIVLDSSTNLAGLDLNNSAQFVWDTSSVGPDGTTVHVVEPQIQVTKQASTNLISVGTIVDFTITIQHTGASTADAFDLTMTDAIPSEFDYVPLSLDCSTVAGSTNDPSFAAPSGVYPNVVITAIWPVFEIGEIGVCKFQLQANGTLTDQPVENVANVAWESLFTDPGQQNDNVYSTERFYDPNDPENINTYHASSNVPLSPLGGGGGCKVDCFRLPVTGFTPGVVTELENPPLLSASDNMGVTLEIPKMKLKMAIVGVPLVKGDWQVDWLSGVGGWLQGTAFPGLSGNSVITSHVTTRFGSDGPFARLNALAPGDNIYITAFGRQYIYQVTSVGTVAPNDITVFKHSEKPLLTLITCAKYNATTKLYDARLVVRARLLQVNAAK
ncbi:MAG TPA: sortase, partial [Anaerolineales bacterium]